MAEYIDKDKLIDRFDELCNTICQYSKKQRAVMCSSCELGIAFDVVDDFPTEDVQPVVRCKDCKHFHLDYFGKVNGASIIVAHEICDLWAGGCRTTQDTFCSNGVRKDGET